MAIYFYFEQVKLPIKYKSKLKRWIKIAVEEKNYLHGQINIIFTSDKYLLEINNQYLSHNYYTDVITFNYSGSRKISADIFISIDTVKRNSKKYSITFEDELYRVIIHGVLHLLGFDDKNEDDKRIMEKNEDYYLDLLKKDIK